MRTSGLLAGLLSAFLCAPAAAQTVPAGFAEAPYAGGLSSPTAMEFAPDGRLFVCQQGGALRVIAPNGATGTLLATPFLSLSVTGTGERGLLGVAFDPDFSSNRRVYVFYSHSNGAENRVSRFVADASNPDVADGAVPEEVILTVPQTAGYHNGGAIHFGPDGKLYVALGEGHSPSNAQSLTEYGGKILRINPDGSIPGDNPTSFPGIVGTTSGAFRRIWAVGLRNPYTFAVQPGTGRMLINDVGSSGSASREEINEGAAGANFGWPDSEGAGADPDHTSPVFSYPRASATPNGACIAGGAFYNPATAVFPASYVGKYFFTDYTRTWMYFLDPATGAVTSFASGLSTPVDVKTGPDGALYHLNRGTNQVRRIEYTGVVTQAIVASTGALSVAEGGSAAVNVRLAADPGGTPVVVDVARVLGDSTVTPSPTQLTFNSANWNSYQPVTVSAAADGDMDDEGASIRLSAAGLTAQTVVVTTLDDDRPAGAPTARITLPLQGATVSGSAAELFGDGTDDTGTVSAQFFVDGVLVSTDTNATGHYHLGGAHGLWDTTALTNGDRVLRMVVSDGTLTGAHEITIVVSNSPATSPPAASGGSGGGRCGLTGIETFLVLATIGLLRRRRCTRAGITWRASAREPGRARAGPPAGDRSPRP